MIRSLVITPSMVPAVEGNAENVSDTEMTLRRNLTQENLEKNLDEGCFMWIDIISPEESEIHWLKGFLKLSPVVIADLLREDRRPTLLVYPQYLFLSLFQPHAHSKNLVSKEIHCIIGKNYYVTVRAADRMTVDQVAAEVRQHIQRVHHDSHRIAQQQQSAQET